MPAFRLFYEKKLPDEKEENLVSFSSSSSPPSGRFSNENSPDMCRTRSACIRGHVFAARTDLWRKSRAGKTSSLSLLLSDSLSRPLFPRLFSFPRIAEMLSLRSTGQQGRPPIYLSPPTRNPFAISSLSSLVPRPSGF